LLNKPQRDPNTAKATGKHSTWLWISLVVIAMAGGLTWYHTRSNEVLVTVALVQTAASSTDSSIGTLLDASGYVVARRSATLASKVTGKVVGITLEEGQKVKAGQIIARLDDANVKASFEEAVAQLKQAEAKLTAAQSAYDDAKPIFERITRSKNATFISAQDFDEARAKFDSSRTGWIESQSAVEIARASVAVARGNLDDTVIRAPFSGVVTGKAAQPGEMVSPVSAGGGFTRTGICTIVDMDSLEVEVDISENFIDRVSARQPVVIKLNAYPDWRIDGSVIAVIPTAERAKATVKVRIAINEKDDRIVPEMGARVSFLKDAPHDDPVVTHATRGVTVPADAVLTVGDTPVAYLVHGNRVERRVLRLGAKLNSTQLVESGLEAGNTIAIGDLSMLRDGDRVRLK